MVSTNFYYNVRDIQQQLFTGVVAAVRRCSTKKVFSQKVRNICSKTRVLEPLFNKHCYKEIPTQMFSCKYRKIFKNSFFQYTSGGCFYRFSKKKMFRHISQTSIECIVTGVLFLSSCRPICCNFVKIEGPVQVFCYEFCEISQNNFMQNNFEQLLLDFKRCCGK